MTILAANNLNDPDMLQIGQERIILPTDGVLYTLRPGETLRRVSDAYGVKSVGDIVSANELGSDPDVVQPGTQLIVPGAEPAWPRRRAAVEPGEPELVAASIGGVGSVCRSKVRRASFPARAPTKCNRATPSTALPTRSV